jgi:hypothetical protein
MINPKAFDHTLDGCYDYWVTSPGIWDQAPKVFIDAGFSDLSQPKVGTCFMVSMDQNETNEDSPLGRICREVFGSDTEEADQQAACSEAVKLLSNDALAKLLMMDEFLAVSF